ncbi:TNR25 factor, partial [Trogon melanurus]|nr:TNR25 factor [Trogon melanurus]
SRIPALPCPQAILAALWLAASELQPPGGRAHVVLQRQQIVVQLHTRPRRHAERPPCPAGMNWIEKARRCCTPCPAGTFLSTPCSSQGNDSVCTTCPTGTFRTQPNTFSECQACYECDHGELAARCVTLCHAAWRCAVLCRATHCLSSAASQVVLSNCSATSNIICGCEPGHFRDCIDKHCSEFSCHQCQPCTGQLIQRPCSEAQDTLCSSCKPNFYSEGGECRPCHTYVQTLPVPQPGTPVGHMSWCPQLPSPCRSTPETCGKECQRACSSSGSRGSGLEYLLLALTGPLFLGALAIYHKRKRLQHSAPAASPLPAAQAAAPMTRSAPWFQVSAWGCSCSSKVTTQAPGAVWQSPEHRALLQEQPRGTAWSGSGEPSATPEPRGALLQGSQLYAVIDVVPVRRWKEFMRVLELREAEIELVELEVAHIRDQQYEMLKRWCQQTSATLDRVFAALEHMDLAGCAEALRRSL